MFVFKLVEEEEESNCRLFVKVFFVIIFFVDCEFLL